MEIRVRIAPAPTGFLHLGTARTALFNWLFARQNKGKFVLRVEDTDRERSQPEFEKDILEGLDWLGLNWDEGPYRQSERTAIYEKYIKKLLADGPAYYCYCAPEELEEERQSMMTAGIAPKYSGKCRMRQETAKTPQVIRFKTPEKIISFKDIIRGEISFDAAGFGDFVIAKNEKTPLYNLAAAIDDEEIKISHVIRGEDHIVNTPKQILIQEALKFNRPRYAHLPLILNPQRAKLSKRYAATSVAEYKTAGYLPETMINFLALLGWHPREEKEILSRDQLLKEFSLERVQRAGAVFNQEKLNWLNGQYLKKLTIEELLDKLNLEPNEKNKKAVLLVRDRLKTLADFGPLTNFIYKLPDYPAELLIWKESGPKLTLKNMELIREAVANGQNMMALAEKEGKGEILWPLRAALSGQKGSPGPLEIMEVIGKEETLKRIDIAIKKLRI